MFQTLPGFRDFYPEDCARRNHLFRLWTQVARRSGYTQYDIPTLEPLELFTEKSGPEIVSQLFNFDDKGGRAVALRPELTPSLARMVGAKANALKRPIKWFNIAENFRYEKPQKGRLRSHYQLNCDIFGEAGAGADAELIATCVECLAVFGLGPQDIVLRLSDRSLWMLYLASLGLEGSQALEVLAIIDKLERTPATEVVSKLAGVFGEAAQDVLHKITDLIAIRELSQLQEFLLAHATTGEQRLQLQARLSDWQILLDSLKALGVGDFVRLDLGIVRGLAYYTGFVFEVFELSADGLTGRALAGGGRYDHLVAKLGYQDLPAVGFGMGDVTLTDLLSARKLLPEYINAPDFYVVCGDSERSAALRLVALTRHCGYTAEYGLKSAGFGKQFKNAAQSGAPYVVIIGSEEVASGNLKLKRMADGMEISLASGQWVELLPALMAGELFT